MNVKFVQIVVFGDHLIGLDSDGHLWKLDINCVALERIDLK